MRRFLQTQLKKRILVGLSYKTALSPAIAPIARRVICW
ncbi:hypothetical protein EDP1_4009 [Pseudomonas putida S610]|nr:hypothetical protein EDP1_4009 [Pseudomonas putida S610]